MKSKIIVLVIMVVMTASMLSGCAVADLINSYLGDNQSDAQNKLYFTVMPGSTDFEDVDISAYDLPSTVKEVKRETSGMGYAIKLKTKGFENGLVIVVGVSSDGIVTGAVCFDSRETMRAEESYGENFVGKDLDGVNNTDLVTGATLTTKAYRNAVKDAINTAKVLSGK